MSDIDPSAAAVRTHLSTSTDTSHEANRLMEAQLHERHLKVAANLLQLVHALDKPGVGRRIGTIVTLGIAKRDPGMLPASFDVTSKVFKTEERTAAGRKLQLSHRYNIHRNSEGTRAAWIASVTERSTADRDHTYQTDTELVIIKTPLRTDIAEDLSVSINNGESGDLEGLVDPESPWWDKINSSLMLAEPQSFRPSIPRASSASSGREGHYASLEMGLGLIPGTLFPRKR